MCVCVHVTSGNSYTVSPYPCPQLLFSVLHTQSDNPAEAATHTGPLWERKQRRTVEGKRERKSYMVLSPSPTLIQKAEVIIELPLAAPRGQVIRRGRRRRREGREKGGGEGKGSGDADNGSLPRNRG